ncbi:MAG TPA: FAD-dependent oxidoreductase [bacterium]|nr:FAD-dependent oxidoreductase [bacterium]HQM52462.1 FAD-dependent oxidoreductase [bacterium]
MADDGPETEILILGGGISGLGAALSAASSGAACLLLEKEERVGGLWGSEYRDGFIFDHGVHGLYAAGPGMEDAVAELKRVAGEIFVEADKNTRILFRGRLVRYPLQPGEFFTTYGAQGLLWALSLVAARLRITLTGDRWMRSFRDYAVGNFGSLLYRIYFERYLKKVWGVDPSRLDLESVARRVKRIRIRTFLGQQLRRALGMPGRQTYDGLQPLRIVYPRHGAQRVVDAMRRSAEEHGARIVTGAEATGIRLDGGRYAVTVAQGGGSRGFSARSIVSTLPLPDLLGLLAPRPDAALAETIRSLRYRALRLLNVMLDCGTVFEAQWTYFQGDEFSFSRINEYRNLSPEFCPPGKTGISVEFNCDAGDRLWSMPDDELFALTVRELGQPVGGRRDIGELVRARQRGYFSVRFAHAYPLMEVGTPAHLERARAFIARFPRLRSIGRQGQFRYMNGDECFRAAADAVAALRNEENR